MIERHYSKFTATRGLGLVCLAAVQSHSSSCKQLARLYSERTTHSRKHHERDIDLGTLDCTEIATLDMSVRSQILLAQPTLYPHRS